MDDAQDDSGLGDVATGSLSGAGSEFAPADEPSSLMDLEVEGPEWSTNGFWTYLDWTLTQLRGATSEVSDSKEEQEQHLNM